MKKIMAALAAGVIFIALAMTSCSDPMAVEEGPIVTLYFGNSTTSRAADVPAVYPYTPIGGDGSFHNRITYIIEFYREGEYGGTVQPVKTGTAKGGEKATIQLTSHGKYDVYVNALLDDTSYAVLNTAAAGVTGTYPHLTIDTTKTTSLTAPMKVETPVFWDFTTPEAISKVKEYIDASSFSTGGRLYMAVNLTSDNWAAIIKAIDRHTGQKKVHLDLSYCITPLNVYYPEQANKVFDPDPENVELASGKAKISKITLPLDATFIVSASSAFPTFKDFTNLAEVNAPSVIIVGDMAFRDRTSLTTVNLPKVKNVSQWAFYGCTSLTTVDFCEAMSIGDHAFQNCTSLKTVNLQKATSIGDYAFQNCTSLTTALLPYATSIGDWAFASCNLETVSLPKATHIGECAFQSCTGLTNVSLPEATNIGVGAFNLCNLTTVELPKATHIGQGAFVGCSNLANVSLPEATSISETNFASCYALKNVSIPKATSIGNYAFVDCHNLETVSFPEATDIGDQAFNTCTSLKELRIPKVETIGDNAFQSTGNTALSLYLGKNPPNLGTTLFPELIPPKLINIYIPNGTTVNDVYGYDYAYPLPTGTKTISDGSYESEWLRGLFGVGWANGAALPGMAYNEYSYSFNYYTP
jgi:hypothetical protein